MEVLMNNPHGVDSESRKSGTWLLVIGLLGVGMSLSITGPLVHALQPKPQPLPTADELPDSLKKIVNHHLDKAATESESSIKEHIKAVDEFFSIAKKGTGPFAEKALGFSSKWRLVIDHMPFTDGDSHQKFIRSKFEEHVFKAGHLEELIQQVVRDYIRSVRNIESKMLVDLRADISDLPTANPLAQLDDKRLQECYDQALSKAIAKADGELCADASRELGSFLAGMVLRKVAARLGISSGILGAGAASGLATFGVGFAVSLFIDQIVSWVWDWWADPQGQLAAEVAKKLDEMNRMIVDGSDDAPGLRACLKEFAQQRAAIRRAALLNMLQHGGVEK